MIMIQVENEMGVIGDARDHSVVAEAGFNKNVPQELMNHLQKNKNDLQPSLKKYGPMPDLKLQERGRMFLVKIVRLMKHLWPGIMLNT